MSIETKTIEELMDDRDRLLVIPVKLTELQKRKLLVARQVMGFLCNQMLEELKQPILIDDVYDAIKACVGESEDINDPDIGDAMEHGHQLYENLFSWLLDKDIQPHYKTVKRVTG
jgi:hypothetical protein